MAPVSGQLVHVRHHRVRPFIAGATSEGGGAVAFPVMTLLFDIAPSTARDFSLMIQAVGMTAAAGTILHTRIPVERRALIWGEPRRGHRSHIRTGVCGRCKLGIFTSAS